MFTVTQYVWNQTKLFETYGSYYWNLNYFLKKITFIIFPERGSGVILGFFLPKEEKLGTWGMKEDWAKFSSYSLHCTALNWDMYKICPHIT